MKTLGILHTITLLFVMVCSSTSQNLTDVAWQRVLGDMDVEYVTETFNSGGAVSDKILAQDDSLNIYFLTGSLSGIGGDKNSPHVGNVSKPDYWLVKMDANGTVLWEKNYGGQNMDIPVSILVDTLRHFIYLIGASKSPVSGQKTQPVIGREDVWVLKLDWDGNIVWDRVYGGPFEDSPQSAVIMANGNLMLACFSLSYMGGGDITQTGFQYAGNTWLLSIDQNGIVIWNRWLGNDYSSTGIRSMITSGNNVLICGGTRALLGSSIRDVTTGVHWAGGASPYYEDGWVVLVDTNGVNLWNRTLGSNDYEIFISCAFGKDGYIYLSGGTAATANNGDVQDSLRGQVDGWVVKLDALGNFIKDKVLGGDSLDFVHEMSMSEHNIYFGLRSNSTVNDQILEPFVGDRDIWVVTLDTSLNIKWSQRFGVATQEPAVFDMLALSDSELIYTGQVIPQSGGDFTLTCWDTINNNSDWWLVKFAPSITTGILESVGLPKSTSCFPNPASDNILFEVNSKAELFITDATGRIIRRMRNETTERKVTVNIANLSPGFYIISNGKEFCKFMKQ